MEIHQVGRNLLIAELGLGRRDAPTDLACSVQYSGAQIGQWLLNLTPARADRQNCVVDSFLCERTRTKDHGGQSNESQSFCAIEGQ